MMSKTSTAILGACGEHYVAAYLSRHQLIVALPRAGVPGCDLLVTAVDRERSIKMQVKIGTDSRRNHKTEGPIYLWYTSFKVIDKHDPNLWFAYVWLRDWPHGNLQPEVFFVPSGVVASTMKQYQVDGDAEFLWMTVVAAETFRGTKGMNAILNALDVVPSPVTQMTTAPENLVTHVSQR